MSIIHDLLKRQISTSAKHPGNGDLLWLLSDFKCLEEDNLVFTGAEGDFVPPLACKFNVDGLHGNLLAVSDEDGVVGLYDTRKRLSESQLSGFVAHRNALFDIAWVPGGTRLVTASGDKTLCLWDVVGETLLTRFLGHKGSVKSVSVKQDEPCVLVSGSRDGSIIVWDTRCTGKGSSQKPVNTIHCAHERPRGKRTRGSKTPPTSEASVTAVLFHGNNKIASCGASDGTVKLWDMRRYYTTNKQAPPPSWHSFATVEKGGRVFGFNSLVSDHYQSSLFASCTDDIIYKYSTSTLDGAPVDGFSGHRNSMFYVRACLSSDGEYLLSGSNCGSAYIWQVNDSGAPPLLLQGHSKEVTAVDWCPTFLDKVATCSDDNDLFLWRVLREGVASCQCRGGHLFGVCTQYTGEEHLKGREAVNTCRQLSRESPAPSRSRDSKSVTTQPQTQRTRHLKHSPEVCSTEKLSPPLTMTPTSTKLTPSSTLTPKQDIAIPLQTVCENISIPLTSTQETPPPVCPTSSSVSANRKRKLVWSVGGQTRKSQTVQCSTCGTSPAAGRGSRSSVARRRIVTCDKCQKTQPSMKSFFKPKE